jgi:MFS family permease
VYAATSYPAGKLSDKFGKKTVFLSGLVVFSLVYIGFAFVSSVWVIFLLFTFYGLYAAATEGILKAWVSDLVADNFRGSAIGLLTMLSSFAVMAGSMTTGILWDSFGSQVPFLISGIVSGCISVGLYFFKDR